MQLPKKSNQRWTIWLVVGVWVLALGQVVWSWGNTVNVSQNAGSSYRPAIAVDSANTIHIVWSDNSINYPGNSEILYKTSSNGGASWSPVQNLSNSANESLQPVIAAAGPNAVAVAWVDGGQIHARIWNGTIWSPAAQLSISVQSTQRLSIAINQSGVAIAAWNEGSAVEIYGTGGPAPAAHFYSRWNGSAWSAPTSMTGRLVAMHGNLAYLATSQRTLLRSTDAGATWGNPISLPQAYIVPDDMKIDSQNRLRMAWFGPTLNAVYAGMYNGQAFSTPALVSIGGYPNTYKQLGLAINKNDQLTLIWSKNVMLPYNVYVGAVYRTLQVLASQSTDGQSWTTPASVLSNSGCFAAIAGSQTDTRFYGTWQSPNCFTGESPDIYVASQNGIFYPGPTFAISGRVQAYGGAPLAGVSVSAGTIASVQSDVNGNYVITGLITGTYTLTAAKSGYRFSALPPVAVPPTRTGQNFTGTLISTEVYSIAGRITDRRGIAVPDVTITTTTGVRAITDKDGNYILKDVSAGVQTITPSKSDNTFVPPVYTIDIAANIIGRNFTIQCETAAATGLNSCELEPGDILLVRGNSDQFFDAAKFIKLGSYFHHAALYVGKQQVTEAVGPSVPPADQVLTHAITESVWWDEHTSIQDWAVLRPKTPTSKALVVQQARDWADAANPIIGYAFSGRTDDTSFYCSKLVWRSYDLVGNDLEQPRWEVWGFTPDPLVTPYDLYNTKSSLVQSDQSPVDKRPVMVVIAKPATQVSANTWQHRSAPTLASSTGPAHLMLVDPDGQRTGYDPHTGTIVNEIPGALYSGPDATYENISVNNLSGAWQVVVTGVDTSDYRVVTEAIDGLLPHQSVWNGRTAPGKVEQFPLTLPARGTVFLPFVRR